MTRTYFKNVSQKIQMVELRWTPQGKRKQDRPKATWRRTVEKEIKAMGLTWDEAEMAALDRIGWRQRVGPHAPCRAKSKKRRRNKF